MADETAKASNDRPVYRDPPNWILQHPKYLDFMRLDASDIAQVHAAFLVYMDLTEVRQWKCVSSFTCPKIEAVLLQGHRKEGEAAQVVLPLPAHRTLSHREVRCVLDRGAPMLLCAVASDSTLVYQRLSSGLVTPDPPVDIQDQGRRQQRKRRIPP
ncbi:tRNA-splicing endonuclease subunit Sen15 [Clupea harengus]|uniref:tRNA-splicing endonuclease subunit Sen15 n=1 Tax=Clupea harengus TaxID=7950 RepID=A0A6P3VIC8_CLUHA|nr:tRNA-splicing endonuclease subunit Sen15 [Clupea harengus]